MNDPAPAHGREKSLPLAGKVAVVTGGSNRIGIATVRLLANKGASVVVGFNKGADRAAQLIQELQGRGHVALQLALADAKRVRDFAAEIKETWPRRHSGQFGRFHDGRCRTRT
jgi:3-oxoacyl-[acyl-carrier protein] reductase